MHKWRKYLIIFGLLVIVGGGVVCYDVYRAQSVAINALNYAKARDLDRLQSLLKTNAITNSLYKDIEPFAVVEEAPAPERKKGFLGRMLDKGNELIGRKPEEAPAPVKGPDLHVCAQTLGEAKGFAALMTHLRPLPVKGGLSPDPRIRYGGINARQYLIRDTAAGGQYLVVSRAGLLDWKISGVRLTEDTRRDLARTCAGAL